MDEAASAPIGEGLARLLKIRGALPGRHPIRLIVLGDRSRGDDSVAFAAVAGALAVLPEATRRRIDVRETGQLDPADLVELPPDGAAIVVDAVIGIPPGEVLVVPLGEVASPTGRAVPRSSHVLPVDQLVALAGVLRGSPPPGVLVGVGAERFGWGEPLSAAVAAAVPALALAISSEVERLVRRLEPDTRPDG